MFNALSRWAGVVAPALFTAAIIAAGAATPGFNHASQYVSELAARQAPFAAWMSYGAIVPFGVLMALYAAGFFTGAHRKRRMIAGGLILAAAGACFVTAGLYRCDAGCSFAAMSHDAIVHNLAAMLGFVVACLAAAWIGVADLRRGAFGQALWSALCAAAMAGAFYAMFRLGPTHELIGLAQRVFLGALFTWLLVGAIVSLRRGAR